MESVVIISKCLENRHINIKKGDTYDPRCFSNACHLTGTFDEKSKAIFTSGEDEKPAWVVERFLDKIEAIG